MKEKLVLGLSGGVDSAVAATILKAVYDVTCVYLDIGLGVGAADAAALAQQMDLPFRRVDIKEVLEANVCQDFASEYLLGRTPLPCARCNPMVKFPALAAVADEIGAKWLATGHYAQTRLNGTRTCLYRGTSKNDQSYMLAQLPQSLLSRIVFPLGSLEKPQIRAIAAASGLIVAQKPDSMEICFIPDGNYPAWMEARGQGAPVGDFVDAKTGKVLGQHLGIHHYTLGQGRGLKLAGPHRYFVSDIRPETNQVVLSDGSDLMAVRVWCSRPNWISQDAWTAPLDVTARFRHSKIETPATVYQEGGTIRVELKEPARVPTPGQLAVFYQDSLVVGSAWIEGADYQ